MDMMIAADWVPSNKLRKTNLFYFQIYYLLKNFL